MFRIGEFSRLGGVSIRMLRYYESAGLITPEWTDPATGYRYYEGRQLALLNRIVMLRNAGFTVAEIADALTAWDPPSLRTLLEKKHAEVLAELELEQAKIGRIQNAMRLLEQRQMPADFAVALKHADAMTVASLRRIIPHLLGKFAHWDELFRLVDASGLRPHCTGEHLALYHGGEEGDLGLDLEACAILESAAGPAPLEPLSVSVLEPVPNLACVTVNGPYQDTARAMESFVAWLGDNGDMAVSGPFRLICHNGPWNEANPENFISEIQIPVTPRPGLPHFRH